MIGQMRIGVTADKNSINTTINTIQTEFKKAGNDIEKAFGDSASKGVKNLKKESENTLNTIKDLNNKIGTLKKDLDTEVIGGKRFKELQKEISQTEKQLEKAINTGGKFKNALIGLSGSFLSIGTIYSTAREAVKAESELARLESILRVTTGATREQIKALNDQATALEKIGVVSAGNVTQTQSQLATFDLQVDTIKTLTPAILDYVTAEKGAMATTEDFKSLTNGLAQALNGNFASLTRVGFVLDDTTKAMISNGTEAERASALVQVLNSTYKDFNINLRDTAEGKLALLNNNLNNLKTTIGNGIIPIMNTFIEVINPVIDGVARFASENPKLTTSLIGVAGAVSLVGTALTVLGGPITLILGGLGLLTALGVGVYNVFSDMNSITNELTESQKKLNKIHDEYEGKVNRLKKQLEELNDEYKKGTIGNKEYQKAVEDNQKALDALAKYQKPIQDGLDIINDKQLNYIEKVKAINELKLNDSEYQKLIGVLRDIQQEQLKTIQLDQEILKSRIKSLNAPISTTIDILNSTPGLETGKKVGGYFLDKLLPDEVIPDKVKGFVGELSKELSKESIKRLDISFYNDKNKDKVNEYIQQLKILEEQEKELAEIGRRAEDIINKPTGGNTPTTTSSSGAKSDKVKQAEKEAKELQKMYEDNYNEDVKMAKQRDERLKKLEDEKQKKCKESLKVLKDGYDETGKVINNVIKAAEKNIETLNTSIGKSLENFKKLKDSLKDLESGKISDLSVRYTDVEDEIKKTQEDLKKIQVNDGISLNYAQKFGIDTLKQIGKAGEIGGYKIADLIEVLELNDQLNKLLEEQKLLQTNLSNEEIKEAQRQASLNPTQKYLEEYEVKKKSIEDEIYLERIKISELEKIKKDEEKLLEKFTQAKENLDSRYQTFKTDIESKITDQLVFETNKRLKILQDFELQAITIADNIRSSLDSANNYANLNLGYAEGGYTGPGGKYDVAGVVHKGEYVIPQHVLRRMPDIVPALEQVRLGQAPTNQTYNNQKTISVGGITVQNKVDLESFFDKLRWKL